MDVVIRPVLGLIQRQQRRVQRSSGGGRGVESFRTESANNVTKILPLVPEIFRPTKIRIKKQKEKEEEEEEEEMIRVSDRISEIKCGTGSLRARSKLVSVKEIKKGMKEEEEEEEDEEEDEEYEEEEEEDEEYEEEEEK
ncbi:hypothetical protein HZH68_004572 [Vespula germanica]|uniref:Uncharacterized protein n=1 Tax=Vespula germanica TaxID=30212 RepID=A0A834KU22_VESGE|nr:hypothetical protein HZH68_004572 [Vespula germanica]